MPVSPTQEDFVLALLGDLSAELEQDKKRAVSSDDLEAALAIKHAATVVARLQSHPSSAKDVLIALEAYMHSDALLSSFDRSCVWLAIETQTHCLNESDSNNSTVLVACLE